MKSIWISTQNLSLDTSDQELFNMNEMELWQDAETFRNIMKIKSPILQCHNHEISSSKF